MKRVEKTNFHFGEAPSVFNNSFSSFRSIFVFGDDVNGDVVNVAAVTGGTVVVVVVARWDIPVGGVFVIIIEGVLVESTIFVVVFGGGVLNAAAATKR